MIHGEDLSEPIRIKRKRDRRTVAYFSYDSTKCRSDDPDEVEAICRASRYVKEGSPIRKTDRAGRGTAGTRLCQGLGDAVTALFWVR